MKSLQVNLFLAGSSHFEPQWGTVVAEPYFAAILLRRVHKGSQGNLYGLKAKARLEALDFRPTLGVLNDLWSAEFL